MCAWTCSNQYQCVLVLSSFSIQEISMATSADIPISPRHSQSVPRGSAGATCLAAGVTWSSGTRAEVCTMGWPEHWDGCPPSPCHGLIQDLPERKTRVSTIPIKIKLYNRRIPISCSLGTAQSHPSLAVAQGFTFLEEQPHRHFTAGQAHVLAWREVLLQTCSWLGAN